MPKYRVVRLLLIALGVGLILAVLLPVWVVLLLIALVVLGVLFGQYC
ncbi:hypothetical protein LJC34_03825 [Oscillospiraceae bacterium OttesenSCG-928-G22]|nr:hypothetical protein [Oscillospiraceae bacterium OttesenSCG-928-G22]